MPSLTLESKDKKTRFGESFSIFFDQLQVYATSRMLSCSRLLENLIWRA